MDAIDAHAAVLWAFHSMQTHALDVVVPAADNAVPYDCVVGMGSYDLEVARECARLYAQRRAPRVIFSGKEGNWTAGTLAMTEAALFAQEAIAMGVPQDAIVLEPEAKNLGENVRYCMPLLRAQGARRVLYVCKPQTKRRLRLTVDLENEKQPSHHRISSAIVAAETTLMAAVQAFGRDRLYNEMVGDLQRILVYPSLGYQKATDVPPAVIEAYLALQAAGYTHHMLKGL